MQFVDQALIKVRAGDGGKGAVAFRREKFVPKGGPSGGDGGDGGSVVLVVDEGLSTLLDFRYRKEYQAPAGEGGANKDKYGRGGDDLVLRVPPGTQVHDEATGERIADLHAEAERFVLARGGKGGRGNIHFATSTDRAPRRSDPGFPGEERSVRLDLKLLADVGLLGFPNVGKSSLIARISAARPKIADYPFTTLVPNLGMVRLSGERSLVVADIPGLIEGAHAGAGLGARFLRHVERTRVLVHLLDATAGPGRAPLRDFDAINRELALFDPALALRPQIVVLNKIDLPDVQGLRRRLAASFARRKIRLLAISAATGEGVTALLEEAWKVLVDERRKLSTGAAREISPGRGQGAREDLDKTSSAPEDPRKGSTERQEGSTEPRAKSLTLRASAPPKPENKSPKKSENRSEDRSEDRSENRSENKPENKPKEKSEKRSEKRSKKGSKKGSKKRSKKESGKRSKNAASKVRATGV